MKTDSDRSPMYVGRPNVGDVVRFRSLVDGIFERKWFTNNGQLVQELEHRLQEFIGVRHCILVCNATVGLQIAAHALNLTGEVIVPANTFVATAHAMQWEGLTPVFADADPDTHCIDPASIEAAVTDRTSAIVGTHLWGQPCDINRIEAIADAHGLKTMYDAAHAFACQYEDRMIGNYGICEVFSFHATKFFNTFEGGAITTNDDSLAKKLRLMKNFGFAGPDQVKHLGTNGKMPEICAAMGLASLDSIDRFIECNRSHHLQYQELLGGVPGLRVLVPQPKIKSNYQYVVIEIDAEIAGCSRDEIMRVLEKKEVFARRYFFPGVHRMEPYRTLYPGSVDSLPVTDQLSENVLVLPTGTAVSSDDVLYVATIILKCFE